MPTLKFLADESCDFAVVRALRGAGFDVFAVSEVMTRSVDHELIAQAYREQRILITEDKDFGWLVFASHVDSAGVILIRFPGNAREKLARTVTRFVEEQGTMIVGAFVVVTNGASLSVFQVGINRSWRWSTQSILLINELAPFVSTARSDSRQPQALVN